MNKQELEKKYPKTTMCLRGLWYDNVPLPIERWEPNFTSLVDWGKLELEACRLIGSRIDAGYTGDDSDFEQLVYGTTEGSEEAYQALAKKYPYLAKFLDECFQGELAEQFSAL